MKILDKFKKAIPAQGMDLTLKAEADDDLTPVVKDVLVRARKRTPQEQAKVEAMQAFVGVACASEDLDPIFVAMFLEAEKLGYRLQADPYTLLHRLNNVQ